MARILSRFLRGVRRLRRFYRLITFCQVRPLQPEDSRNCGWADQPGGVAVVPWGGRSGQMSSSGHVLADRDGNKHTLEFGRIHGRTNQKYNNSCNIGGVIFKLAAVCFFISVQGGHVLTPLPAATPLKPGSAVSDNIYYYLFRACETYPMQWVWSMQAADKEGLYVWIWMFVSLLTKSMQELQHVHFYFAFHERVMIQAMIWNRNLCPGSFL